MKNILILLLSIFILSSAIYQPSRADDKAAAAADEQLSAEQRRIADQYRHLEEVLLRMAELNASTDPRRAELLLKAVAESKDRLIGTQFERLTELLNEDRLSQALEGQEDLQKDLARLLELLLSENRDKRIAAEKARVREQLRRLNRVIREQKNLESRTESGEDAKQLAAGQGELAQNTGRLADDVKSGDGGNDKQQAGEGNKGEGSGKQQGSDANKDAQPSGGQGGEKGNGQSGDSQSQGQSQSQPQDQTGQSPSPAAERLQAARDKMKEAQESLDKAQREGAVEQQEEALERLEEAKAELEKILRQLREEEMKRTLTSLAARFAAMLKLEREIYKGTQSLDKTPLDNRAHEHEIAAGRLAAKQSSLVQEAEKALLLLKEDGTAVAFPESVAQMRDDMREAAQRLERGLTDPVTQGIEEDVMAALEEMIEALKAAIEKLEEGKTQNSPAAGGMEQDPALIEQLAELKMIRALQMRANLRTARYAKLLDGDEAADPDLLDALRRLAERQAKIHKVTRKLNLQGQNGP